MRILLRCPSYGKLVSTSPSSQLELAPRLHDYDAAVPHDDTQGKSQPESQGLVAELPPKLARESQPKGLVAELPPKLARPAGWDDLQRTRLENFASSLRV